MVQESVSLKIRARLGTTAESAPLIQPQNIMLVENDQASPFRIIDFGSAVFKGMLLYFFFTHVTGPRRSLSLKLSDTRVYEPQMRARLGTATHLCGSDQASPFRIIDFGSDVFKGVKPFQLLR